MNRGVPQSKVDEAKDIAGDGDLDERCKRLLAHFNWFGDPKPAVEPEPEDEQTPRQQAGRRWEQQLRHASQPCPHVCETCRKAS